jgi:hypothetical protein
MRLDDEMEVWVAARDVDAVIEPVPHVLMHDAVAARQSLVEQDLAEQGNDPTPTFAPGLEELQPLLRIASASLRTRFCLITRSTAKFGRREKCVSDCDGASSSASHRA